MGELADKFRLAARGKRDDILQVFDNAVQRVAEESNIPKAAGGLMPVDTEFLRNSISVNGVIGKSRIASGIMAKIDPYHHRFGYTAPYTIFVELGTSRQEAQPFLRTAAMKFPMFLAEEARKVNV